MPSVNVAMMDLGVSTGQDYVTNPMKPALTIVEHKIRNLEKRKVCGIPLSFRFDCLSDRLFSFRGNWINTKASKMLGRNLMRTNWQRLPNTAKLLHNWNLLET